MGKEKRRKIIKSGKEALKMHLGKINLKKGEDDRNSQYIPL